MGDYSFFRAITINPTDDKVGETDSDYAVLLNLTAAGSGVISDLAAAGNGGDIQNTAAGGASGAYTVPADLTFRTTADLTIEGANLDFEVEYYDAATGGLIAWVQSGVIASDHFNIYLVYGNADVTTSQENVAGTWDANFKGVWHMAEASATTYVEDSTGAYDGTKVASGSPTQGTGQIGYGQTFDGINDYIAFGNNANLQPASALTFSLWLNITNFTESYAAIGGMAKYETGYGYLFDYFASANGVVAFQVGNGTWAIVIAEYSEDTFAYFVGTWDGTTVTLYKDGVSVGTPAAKDVVAYTGTTLDIGRYGTNSDHLFEGGTIDEVRISNIARTANYVTSTFNNQSSPSTFYSVGAEQLGRMPPWGGIIIFQDPGIM